MLIGTSVDVYVSLRQSTSRPLWLICISIQYVTCLLSGAVGFLSEDIDRFVYSCRSSESRYMLMLPGGVGDIEILAPFLVFGGTNETKLNF